MTLRTLMQAGPAKATELFAKLSETSGGAVKTREKLFADLKAELELHAGLEEQHLFPILSTHPGSLCSCVGLCGQAPEHDADHGHADEGGGDAAMPLEVAGETAVATDPADGALDDPALRQHHEAVPVAAAHDLHLPPAGAGDGSGHLRPLIARVADDALDEREQPARLTQQRFGAVPVLHAGGMHDHREKHAYGVGQQVALAANDLLTRVVAGRVERRSPFCAAFAVWLSMIAVVGLASRPACSRTAT